MKGWTCYPLWGLEMADNGFGLEKPIFGDATIVTRGYVQKFCPPDETTTALMSGGGMRDALESINFVGPAPLDRLIDIPPGAFIAVRRAKPDDAIRYAESIRTVLTASFVLTAGETKGFAMTPLALHWAAMPSQVRLDSSERLQTQYKVVVSNFIHLTPVRVSHRQLSDAWQTGACVQGKWRMHKGDPLSEVLVGDWNGLTGLRKRIRTAASALARAMESVDPVMSTLNSVVALELLLKDSASSFKEMEEMLKCIFAGPTGPEESSRLFSNRNAVAHEGRAIDGDALHSKEVASCWAAMLLAAVAGRDLRNVDEFIAHLRGRVLAHKLGKHLRELDKADLAAEVERAATMIRKKK